MVDTAVGIIHVPLSNIYSKAVQRKATAEYPDAWQFISASSRRFGKWTNYGKFAIIAIGVYEVELEFLLLFFLSRNHFCKQIDGAIQGRAGEEFTATHNS